MRLNKISLATLVLGGSALLAACGGGGDSAPVTSVATTDTAAVINPTTGAAVVSSVLNKGFDFTTGVPSFGTTSATSLTLSGSGATPSFAISSGGNTASGVMTYGSCIFTIGSDSTFPAGHPLVAGSKITVNPCTLSVGTAGVKADGSSSAANVTFVLGTTNSSPVSVTVTISSMGVVTVNNSPVGHATVVIATGAGS
ncbi:MAG: hypothetical protein JJD98_03390 [Polaromonas sp.]|nr:hypothetical protein [Polaromonas sp.]